MRKMHKADYGNAGWVEEFFLKNQRRKLFALAIAFALWFFVAGEKTAEVGLMVPLEITGIPAGMRLSGDIPAEVEVRFSGPRAIVDDLSPSSMSIKKDLSKAVIGENLIRISPRDIKTPVGVDAVLIKPSTIAVIMHSFEGKDKRS